MEQVAAGPIEHAAHVIRPCCVPGFVIGHERVACRIVVDLEPAADALPDVVRAGGFSGGYVIGGRVVVGIAVPLQCLDAGAGFRRVHRQGSEHRKDGQTEQIYFEFGQLI